MRMALIGLGNIAKTIHLPHLLELPEVEVVGVCRRNKEMLQEIAKHFRIEQVYTDYRKMIAEQKPEAVFITTKDHFQAVSDCLDAGVHVLVEKPFCDKLMDAEKLVVKAREKGLILMVAYMKRYDPGYELGVREVAKTQGIIFVRVHNLFGQYRGVGAEMYSLEFETATSAPMSPTQDWTRGDLEAQFGKGATNDSLRAYQAMLIALSHDINALRGLMGEPRRIVKTEIWGNPAGHFEFPNVVSILEFSEKIRCVVEFAPTLKRRQWDEVIEVIAPDRSVSIRFNNPQLKNSPARVIVREGSDVGITTEFEGSHQAGFKREILHFIDSIKNNTPPRTSAADGKKDMEVIAAIVRSYVENRPVEL